MAGREDGQTVAAHRRESECFHIAVAVVGLKVVRTIFLCTSRMGMNNLVGGQPATIEQNKAALVVVGVVGMAFGTRPQIKLISVASSAQAERTEN